MKKIIKILKIKKLSFQNPINGERLSCFNRCLKGRMMGKKRVPIGKSRMIYYN